MKVGTWRLLGGQRYSALQALYWRERVKRLAYPFEFRGEIEQTIRLGDTVLDVGANVGQYAALLARLVGPSGRVLGFEPDPYTYRMLVASMRRFGNVEVRPLALGDFAGSASIARVLDGDGLPNIGLTHLATNGEPHAATVSVARLDDIAESLGVGSCSFVKIDVEGSELRVLGGAQEFLARFRPLLLIELDDAMSARYGASPTGVISFLRRLGYSLWKSHPPESRGGSALFRITQSR